ncbi:MAG: NUDIX hydrolase [Candidatus Nanopelagicales bacterium]|nr:NUDIX hydrolase [Candidatus Nanopelagicales bacterium]
MWIWIAIAAVVVLLVVYLSSTAGRLDRLHHRVEASRQALEAQLADRAAMALELAGSGLLDPASSLVLADAAAGSVEGESIGDWTQAESDLTRALAVVFPDPTHVEAMAGVPGGEELVGRLGAACHKVEMSRRFHGEAVRACQLVRRHKLVRLFRLAGRAPWPLPADFDADVPPGLIGR